ncbi:MAG: formylmethanofuran dehydrogenase subunit C [Thiogranum sp.]
MTALTLTLRDKPRHRIDLAAVCPDRLSGSRSEDVARLSLVYGNRRVQLGELFDVTGQDPNDLIIRNSCSRLDAIGAGMETGKVCIHGDTGDYLGWGMQGGTIEVHGDSGHWTASGMRNGIIHINGNCGDFAGAAIPGDHQGMRGGTLLVNGNAGDRTGDRMRRGRILIEGDAGDYCGTRMVAGTISVLGKVGIAPGYAMRRGTLLLAQQPVSMPPTFNDCGEHTLGFLRLLLDSFAELNSRFSQLDRNRLRVRRYTGDLACDGKGELLVWVG